MGNAPLLWTEKRVQHTARNYKSSSTICTWKYNLQKLAWGGWGL